MKRYSAKHVAVTGGASGIGKAMVERSANEGATVYILDVNNEAATTVVNDIVE
ncbi:MAG: SDR family NAD(P)-dependent oxidoreductase [Opitutales bacterium]|nr:SDR family NAD(P)-dependent oxidoreductase [Opitutales bacterium]